MRRYINSCMKVSEVLSCVDWLELQMLCREVGHPVSGECYVNDAERSRHEQMVVPRRGKSLPTSPLTFRVIPKYRLQILKEMENENG